MPLWKMRRIEEATTPPAPPLAPENLRAAIELSDLCLRLRPRTVPRGLRRYRSLEEAHRSEATPPERTRASRPSRPSL